MIRFHLQSLALISIVSATACSLLTGCLQTRDSQAEENQQQVLQKQVYSQQTAIADNRQRFESIDEDMRNLGGKIETNENRVNVVGNKLDKANLAQAAKKQRNRRAHKDPARCDLKTRHRHRGDQPANIGFGRSAKTAGRRRGSRYVDDVSGVR